jgi:hypothetical protein
MTVSREQIRRQALNGEMEEAITWELAPPVFAHLLLAAYMYKSGLEVKRLAEEMCEARGRDRPEHHELIDALRTAEKGSAVALDAAVNAVWEYIWVWEECGCPDHRIQRTRENAEIQ